MNTRHFDQCLLGNGIGGLVATALLQKKGVRVLVLRDRKTIDFDPDQCEFLNGFTLKPLLKRVGFHPSEVNAIPTMEAPVQLVFKDHRLDCYGDEERFQREIQREFPKFAKPIMQLFRESYGQYDVYQHLLNSRTPLPPRGFFARRKLDKVLEQICDLRLLESRKRNDELSRFGVGDDFVSAIDAMELAVSDLKTDWTSGAQLAHLLALVRWEGYEAGAGQKQLKEMLLTKIRERGGKVMEYDEIEEVVISRGKIVGCKLRGAELKDVGFRALTASGNIAGLLSLQPDFAGFSKWKKNQSELPIFARKAYQNLRVHPEGIPTGMKNQGLILPDALTEKSERRRWVRALRYVLRKSEANGKECIDIGLSALMPVSDHEVESKKIESEMRDTLKMIIPFLDDYLVSDPMPLFVPSAEGIPGDFRGRFIYSAKEPRMLGVYGISPESPIRNTYHADHQVFPGLGLDGEVIAGFQVGHYVGEYLASGQKDPLA